MSTASRQSAVRLPDVLTVTGIALVTYAASNVVHEGLGHGVACLAVGGRPLVLSSVHFDCGDAAIGPLARRAVAAAGTGANFVAGACALLAFRMTNPRERPHIAYALWLFTTANLLAGAGYFLFSGVGNIGDWADVARDVASPVVWRPAMTIGGALLYFLLARQSGRSLGSLVGGDNLSSRRAARRLTVTPYIAGGVLFCIAGFFNPVGPLLIAISAAASSFGGSSGLLWLTSFTARGQSGGAPPDLDRHYAWIAAGGVIALIFVGILGPGVRF